MATTWYVREDGGSASESTGLADVAYPGTGTGTASAFGTLRWAIEAASFGDTIKIHAGHTIVHEYLEGTLIYLPDKGAGTGTDADYITITSTGAIPELFDTAWPSSWRPGTSEVGPQYTRVTTADAVNMPKIVVTSESFGLPLLDFYQGAHHYKFVGLELTNSSGNPNTYRTNVLISSTQEIALEEHLPHHIKFDRCWIHPQEETGHIDTDDFLNTSCLNAIYPTWHHFEITKCAIQGFTGCPSERNSNSILTTYCHHGLIEDSVLECNGQLFYGGGGFAVPEHSAEITAVSWDNLASELTLTLDNTEGIAIGTVLSVFSQPFHDSHIFPTSPSNATPIPATSGYVNAEVLSVNSGTGVVVTARPSAGWDYRGFRLYRFGATGGTYTLTWMGQTTGAITWAGGETERAAIQSALEALSNVASGDVQVEGNGVTGGNGWPYADYFVSFARPAGAWKYPTPVNFLSMASSLTGGSAPGNVYQHFSESSQWLEEPENGSDWDDIPAVGGSVVWSGDICNNMTHNRCIFSQRREWRSGVTNTLASGIDADDTSLTLTDASRFTSAGGLLIIDSEFILYTGKTSNTLTGLLTSSGTPRNSGNASPHSGGATVTYHIQRVKGFIETKSLRDSTFNACIFTGQATGLVGTVRNQGGTVPWATNSNTTWSNIICDETTGFWACSHTDGTYKSENTDNWQVRNALFLYPYGDPGSGHHTQNQAFIIMAAGTNIVFDHVTAFCAGPILTATSSLDDGTRPTFSLPTNPLVLKNSIFRPTINTLIPLDNPGEQTFEHYEMFNCLIINDQDAEMGNISFYLESAVYWEENDPSTVFASVSPNEDYFEPGLTNYDAEGDYTVVDSRYIAGGARDGLDGETLGFDLDEFISEAGFNPFTGESAPEGRQAATGRTAASGRTAATGRTAASGRSAVQ